VVRAALTEPNDDLKPRFARGDEDDGTQTSFASAVRAPPKRSPEEEAAAKMSARDAALLADLRALEEKYKEAPPPPPKKRDTDLNGIKPQWLLVGALTYGVVSVLGWQFTGWVNERFGEMDIDENAFFVVTRLKYAARYALILMGSLGSSLTAIAAVGQTALAVQVSMGIARGELDPNKERVDPKGQKKQEQLQMYLDQMLGRKD
jgi:hypothetical protein